MDSQPPTSIHCSPSSAVIQVLPHLKCGQIQVDDRKAQKIAAYVILPNSGTSTISCPINYFQENASLPSQWIRNDEGVIQQLSFLYNIKRFLLTISTASTEILCSIPKSFESRLCEYFMLDISHNKSQYKGFDCYAFVSFLANVIKFPTSPPFDYSQNTPKAGDIVAISDGSNLPDSIKHWALYLGNDMYLSKFGKTGMDSQSLVEVMNLQEMKNLYSCTQSYIASKHINSLPWSGI